MKTPKTPKSLKSVKSATSLTKVALFILSMYVCMYENTNVIIEQKTVHIVC